MSPGNPFILGSKGQGHETQKDSAGVGLCTRLLSVLVVSIY